MTPPRPFDADPAPEPVAIDVSGGDAEPVDATPAAEVIAVAPPDAPEAFEDLTQLPLLLEALLFVADHPVEEAYLARALEVSPQRVMRALDDLADTLREAGRGIRVQRGPDGVVLVSAPEAATQVERFLGLELNRRLSTAALETLAIIAYKQPVTRGQIDAVRGVSSDGALQTLRARGLIEPAGYANGPGRPTLFRTTQRFLQHFGLERTGQLPPLPEEVDIPLSEIGAQLGLDEQAIANALAEVEAAADAEPTAEEQAAAAALELSADASALASAAEQAFASAQRPDSDEA
ncbi:MAG: SMC-Scp complex subunit ScpB [Dehalococcoidia bacterium]|nr:MAG: SMC-Scp complex subunit ScpB [Dehalococcoidia bacterium]